MTSALCVALAACDRPAIEWTADASRVSSTPAVPATDGVAPPPTAVAGSCAGSVALARAGGESFAAWWRPRADSGVDLVVQRAIGDARWLAPELVDARESSHTGCARPAPSIAADSVSGYVLVAYSSTTPAGTAVWFAHAMPMMAHGARTLMWHAPVAVVFGDRLVRTAVAGVADTVVVAYPDPESRAPALTVAISRSAGHIFADRLSIATPGAIADDPTVTLSGRAVTVSWLARPLGDSVGVRMTRAGNLR